MESAVSLLTILSGRCSDACNKKPRWRTRLCRNSHLKVTVVRPMDSTAVTSQLLLGRGRRAQAGDRLGLARDAGVGTHRLIVLVVTRAVYATVRPAAAIRRPLLNRNLVVSTERRDFDFGGKRCTGRSGQHKESDGETAVPHSALRAARGRAAVQVQRTYRHSTLVIS